MNRDTDIVDQIWVPVVIAVFGNVVAVAIVVATNRQAVKREESRQDREDARLERLRRDARTQRASDNRRRVTDLQKDYYVDFYEQLRAASLRVHDSGYKLGPELKSDWNLPVYESLIRLRVFTTDATYFAADNAYACLWSWGDSGEGGYESELEIDFTAAMNDYLIAIRHDLGIAIDQTRISSEDILI